MPPSAESSNAFFLQLIWQTTAVLALGSILILAILVICRYFSNRRIQRKKKTREELTRYFYAAISSPVGIDEKAIPRMKEKDMDVLRHIALDILRTVKGRNHERVLDLLRAWNIRPYLISVLKKGRRGEKIQALTLLSLFDDKENLDIFLHHARSEDSYVQLAALRGLAMRDGTQHITTVVDILSRTENTNRLMLADVLRHFGTDAAPALMQLARTARQVDVRVAALIALGMLRSLAVVPDIIPLLKDPSEDIRAQAAKALGKIGDIRASPALTNALNDHIAQVRAHAAQALGGLKDEKALTALAQRLDDKNWWVGFRAAQALVRMGDNGISLLHSFRGRQDNAGIMADQVLAEMTEA